MVFFINVTAFTTKSSLIRKFIAEKPPLRSELLDKQQMVEYAKTIADKHQLNQKYHKHDWTNTLSNHDKVLEQIHKLFINSSGIKRVTITDREWRQSFYLIRNQIPKVEQMLSEIDGYWPLLNTGASDNVPRVFEIAKEFIAHTDSQLVFDNILTFIEAYQEISSLRNGELKALKAMLKLALIDNLCRLAARITIFSTGQELAEFRDVKEDEANCLSFRNAVCSLRILDTFNWLEFVDKMSIVEEILSKGCGGVYSKMDFLTRDRYRGELEKLAIQSKLTEIEVARRVVFLSKKRNSERKKCEFDHIGFYLIGKGRNQLKKSLGIPLFIGEIFWEKSKKHNLLFYIGSILIFTILAAAVPFVWIYELQVGLGILLLVGILILITSSQLAKGFIDSLLGAIIESKLLPRLDFSKGIPKKCSTLVIIPALLKSKQEIEDLIHGLEVRFLGNRSKNLYFGVLTDFKDANQKFLYEDNVLLQLLKEKIEKLNIKYDSPKNQLFFLFHRSRSWNPYDKIWMGYERKRGKIVQLNTFLQGKEKGSFSHVIGDPRIFHQIKYVITLDQDTQLPKETAWKMVATMAHPMNKAVFCAKKQRVISGYGILQPRIGTDLKALSSSHYQRVNGSRPDIDSYTRASPDVYQDLFAEGSFEGKGIYDLDILVKSVNNRFPENRILSHDLIEGCYARSGLLSDVELFEKSFNYWNDVKRRHRWMRGDWQIAAWVGTVVPSVGKTSVKNSLSALSRWKIFDNLRNSILPLALFLLLLFGWVLSPTPVLWTLYVGLVLIFPGLLFFVFKIIGKPKNIFLASQWKQSSGKAYDLLLRDMHIFISLPFEAYNILDAIVRTGWRLWISKKKLLEWEPSNSQNNKQPDNILQAYLIMWIGPLVSVLLSVYFGFFGPTVFLWIGCIPLTWLFSPLIIWQFSKPFEEAREMFTEEQALYLRKLARRTWTYYEDFVYKGGNGLPLDHFQEYPVAKVAGYTSPTNIGLTLLSNLTAYDLGYITIGGFIERSTHTIKSMTKLDRYKGHFYNWYDIETLKPSSPKYVSTVDSGNLIGHLLTFRQGILEISHKKVFEPNLFKGLLDTVMILDEKINLALWGEFKNYLSNIVVSHSFTPSEVKSYIEELTARIGEMLAFSRLEDLSDIEHYLKYLYEQSKELASELYLLAPWLWLSPAPSEYRHLVPSNILTLHELANLEVSLFLDFRCTSNESDKSKIKWLNNFTQGMIKAKKEAIMRIASLDFMIEKCADFTNVEYTFLYNQSEHLLATGYHVENNSLDTNNYDNLASEARLATFVGICQGKLPVKSWFALGRTLVGAEDSFTLLSANGTMFEYLMPVLIMPTFDNTLLDHACKAAVKSQISHGKDHGIPWGISESAYNATDTGLNYQYKVFGIPELSVKQNYSEDDKVISPYSSALALMVYPDEAFENLQQLSAAGYEKKYGFYEAIDYTTSRTQGHNMVPVRSFMTHHQGMIFISLSHCILNKPMQKRFVSDPQVESASMLLQERIPEDASLYLSRSNGFQAVTRRYKNLNHQLKRKAKSVYSTNTIPPQVQLLSNGKYHLMINNAGNGYSRWRDIAITKWEESEVNNCGIFCHVEDLDEVLPLSTTHGLDNHVPGSAKATFSLGEATFDYSYNGLQICKKVFVSPVDDIEIRRFFICNETGKQKTIKITSYCDVMLSPLNQSGFDRQHNEGNYQIDFSDDRTAILRGQQIHTDEKPNCWMFLLIKSQSSKISPAIVEANESVFVSSGNSPPKTGEIDKKRLFNAHKPFEDSTPVITCQAIVNPGKTVIVDLCLGVAESKQSCKKLLEKISEPGTVDNYFGKVRTYEMLILKQTETTEEEAKLFQQLTGLLVFHHRVSTNNLSVKNRNLSSKPSVLVLQIQNTTDIQIVSQVVRMHAYWRLKGLAVKLFIWNKDSSCYKHFLQKLIFEVINGGCGAETLNRQEGGITVIPLSGPSNDHTTSLEAANYVIYAEDWSSLVKQAKDYEML